MGMLDIRELRRTCRTRLKTISTLPSENHWMGRKFDPPNDGSLWVQEKIYIISEQKTCSGFIRGLGETRYDIYTPRGESDGDAQDLAKAIAEAFEAGQSLQGTGIVINLYRTERGVLSHDETLEEWSFVPVVVRWRVFTEAASV